jgi:DNA (cytosine-5)-methyltransferase 1
VAIRKDLVSKIEGLGIDLFNPMPHLNMEFSELGIKFNQISDGDDVKIDLPEVAGKLWHKCLPGNALSSVPESKGNFFNDIKVSKDEILPTLASQNKIYHADLPRRLNDIEYKKGTTFPIDYNFMTSKFFYICGMSVPPVMTAQIATRIKEQWFDRMTS